MVSDLAMSTIRLKRQSHNAGFTLLEILLAMLVLGMVVSMVSLSLSSSISAIDSTQEQGEIYYRAQVQAPATMKLSERSEVFHRISSDSSWCIDFVKIHSQSQGSLRPRHQLG